MNILILSCGTRNKVVQYFRMGVESVGGCVVATDMNSLAPALYEAHKFLIAPKMTDPNYLNVILDICESEKINGALSLIDPELSLLAKHEDAFKRVGTTVIGSSYDLCEMSLNKYSMYQWLVKHDYKTVKSFVDWSEFVKSGIEYPVFVKPAKGSASIAATKADTEEAARFLFEKNEGMMIQEYMKGEEIGADVYIDMISGEVVSIFTKKKLLMRAGETDKAVSFKEPKLFDLIERFVREAGYRGQIDIDIFAIDGSDEYCISEVNPRFGGGYPHAHESGVDHVKLILENLSGRANKKGIGNYKKGIYMMKYSEVQLLLDDIDEGGVVCSYPELKKLLDPFKKVLHDNGISIKDGSKLSKICDAISDLDKYCKDKEYQKSIGDPKEFFKNILGFWSFLRKIVNLSNHERFSELKPHLELLASEEFKQNEKKEYNNETNKIFELLFALALFQAGCKDIKLDSPTNSKGNNPDILATWKEERWGFACKTVYSSSEKTFFDNIKKGIDQIQKSEADKGYVVINFRNIIDHSFWDDKNKTNLNENRKKFYTTWSLESIVEKIVPEVSKKEKKIINEIGKENIFKAYRDKKASFGFIAFCSTIAPMALQGQPLPSDICTLILCSFNETTSEDDLCFLSQINEALHDRIGIDKHLKS